ncbi:hypothetical protein HQ545_02490 [Candidatus Woesearchaeota archaeon]|nr:hypothetical protein [Candidatus Woesearchaeota archaeon]
MTTKLRIQLSDKAKKELESLKDKLEMHSITEVIRSSVSVNKFLIEQKEEGNELILRNRMTRCERIILILK